MIDKVNHKEHCMRGIHQVPSFEEVIAYRCKHCGSIQPTKQDIQEHIELWVTKSICFCDVEASNK